MAKLLSGYVGSGVVHLAVVAALVAGSWFVRDRVMPPEPEPAGGGGGVVVLSPAPSGSAPASGGASVMTPVRRALPVVGGIDSAATIRAIERTDREAALRQANATKPAPRPVSRPVEPAVSTVTAPVVAKPVGSGPSGGAPAIVGARVASPGAPVVAGSGSGPVTSATAGAGGDDAPGVAAFYARLRTRFSDVFQPLFAARGVAIQSARETCVVRLRVTPAGEVVLSGWHVVPADARFEAIIRDAVAAMGPVGTPPSGAERVLLLPVSGSVE